MQNSSPSRYGCGLILEINIRFKSWTAQRVVDKSNILMKIPINDVLIIQSISVDGNFEPNEGYCIEILKGIYYQIYTYGTEFNKIPTFVYNTSFLEQLIYRYE